MGILLSATVLLVFVSLTFGAEVEIVVDSEPRTKEDTALPMIQAAKIFSANPCIAQKTCTDCIRAGCVWCAKEDRNYTDEGKKRCNYHGIIKDECGQGPMVYATMRSGAFEADGRRSVTLYLPPKATSNGMAGTITRYADDHPYIAFAANNNPDYVQVTFEVKCSRDKPWEKRNFCIDVKKGDEVAVTPVIEVLSCPENRDEWKQKILFYELHGGYKILPLVVSLKMECECDCDSSWNEERNSPKCSGRGTYHCGVCSCYDNRYGKECECEGKKTGDTDDDEKACIAPGDTKVCSGRGRCHCGICECFNKASVTGRFCECDSFSCARSEDGQICGGKDHGKCVCGKCECKGEWTGPACDCKEDTEACRSPYNGLICHGFGECKCGRCHCFERDGIVRSGTYCEACATCPIQYAKYQTCAPCLKYVP